MSLRLGVNIDHVATLRQVRGTSYPDLVAAALACEKAGARGITVHLREDRRHIQDGDVVELRKRIATRLNLEMACSDEITRIAVQVRPDEACLVPEKRLELTTEGGLDVAGGKPSLKKTVERLTGAGIVVSLFVDPERRQLDASAELGVPYVELHTGAFCGARGKAAVAELKRLIDGARHARSLGLKVNAGHGINMANVGSILKIPYLDTLNIGHSIVARAISCGIEAAVREMLRAMRHYKGGR